MIASHGLMSAGLAQDGDPRTGAVPASRGSGFVAGLATLVRAVMTAADPMRLRMGHGTRT